MNIFKRIFRIGQAEIHAAVDKMEDPIKMTEQGLRELRIDLTEATESFAKVKALAIRTENEQLNCDQQSRNYAEKAILIMQKAQSGQVDLYKAEELAREALSLRRKYYAESEELGHQVAAGSSARSARRTARASGPRGSTLRRSSSCGRSEAAPGSRSASSPSARTRTRARCRRS